MADFPTGALAPPFICSFSDAMNGRYCRIGPNIGAPVVIAWGTASSGVYVPLWLPWPYLVARMFWVNGTTVTGACDIGIYTISGARICHATAAPVNQSGASASQFVVPDTGAITLSPGRYFLALSCSGTTAALYGVALTAPHGRVMGLYQQATVGTLPASATFAAYNALGFPLFGITNTASGF